MPFTTSHPAIIMPLKKWLPAYFSLSGLMAGAVAPDLLYFLVCTTEQRWLSHTWLGLFIFCLPAGLLFSFAFHYLFKLSVIENLPSVVGSRLAGLAYSKFKPLTVKEWSILIVSILVGTLSHFFWDSWTHGSGELTRLFPILLRKVEFFGVRLMVSYWAGHLSSLFGVVVILLYLFKGGLLPESKHGLATHSAARKLSFWTGAGVASLAGAYLAVWIHAGKIVFDFGELPWQFYAYQKLGLGSWAGFFWYSCVMTLLEKRTRTKKRET